MSQGRDYSGGARKKRGGGGRFHGKNNFVSIGDMGKEVLDKLDENSQVIKQFRNYSIELDDKHDRFERIVKLSRDITIESKRIIFLLHTIDRDEKHETILNEAEKRLENITKFPFKNIAKELDGHDSFQYIKAYRPGMQEFIEAMTFQQYLKNKKLTNWNHIGAALNYKIEKQETKSTETISNQEKNSSLEKIQENLSHQQEELTTAIKESNPEMIKYIQTTLIPQDYILGIADLTGELMRKCINNLSTGNIAGCFETCNFVRNMYQGFLGITTFSGREINRKLLTLKQSLNKIENVCYTIKIRGSEIPRHMLASVAIAETEENIDEDEGFY
ncbi:translin-associated protein X [Leptopilina heterotoma]|uniref:translin-associated protein X n=1 Tax=Leptopilina heterotoma TaxID=63436 RepID=UPI001CA8016E|nr:translin-associated protein X [Leptopilina heterotoma]